MRQEIFYTFLCVLYAIYAFLCIYAFLALNVVAGFMFLRLQKNKCLFLCLSLYIMMLGQKNFGIFDLGGIFSWIKSPALLSTI